MAVQTAEKGVFVNGVQGVPPADGDACGLSERSRREAIVVAKGQLDGKPIALVRVWGVSLLERCLGLLYEAGCRKVIIVADRSESFSTLVHGLPISSHFDLNVVNTFASESLLLELFADCLYDGDRLLEAINRQDSPDEAVILQIRDESDLKEAASLLFRRTQGHCYFLPSFFYSTQVRALLSLVAPTGITPNSITLFGLLLSLAAALCIVFGTSLTHTILAVFLIQAALICDLWDGHLARIKREFSPIGKWLDGFVDHSRLTLWIVALSVRYALSGNLWAIVAGLVALAGRDMGGCLVNLFKTEMGTSGYEEHLTRKGGQGAQQSMVKRLLWGLSGFFGAWDVTTHIICLGLLLGRGDWVLWYLALMKNTWLAQVVLFLRLQSKKSMD